MSIVDEDGIIDLSKIDDAKATPSQPSAPPMRTWKVYGTSGRDYLVRAHSLDFQQSGAVIFLEYAVVQKQATGEWTAVPRISQGFNASQWRRFEEVVPAPESDAVH